MVYQTDIGLEPHRSGQERELTPKQQEFARLYAASGMPSEAYREAYKPQGKPNTVYRRANELVHNSRIKARVMELRANKAAAEQVTAETIRERVRTRLELESTAEDSPPQARIRALELLGRLDGVQAFEADRKEVTHKRGVDAKDAEATLRLALERALTSLGVPQQQAIAAPKPDAIDTEFTAVEGPEGAPYDPGCDL